MNAPAPVSPAPATRTLAKLLAIESTCDETAAAVVTRTGQVLGQCIATQEKLHEPFGGVVPEIAARAHLERILPVVETSMKQASATPEELSAIAVADRPGLAGSLLVGVVAAKTLAIAWNKPLVAINHLHAHLFACTLGSDLPTSAFYPAIGLIVSGGHTTLYRCRGPIDLDYLGGTIDDAAGEAFDKVAAMLQCDFPGGVEVAKLAEHGDPAAHAFPRSMIHEPHDNFSFSGLKTAFRYAIAGPGRQDFAAIEIAPQAKADLCASFEAAVVDVLVQKSRRAVRRERVGHLLVGGGVAANRRLREELRRAAARDGFEVHIAPPSLCTDNAVMGAIAWEKFDREDLAGDNLDITPGLQRGF